MADAQSTLFLLTPVWVRKTAEGNWVLPRKFVDGIREYCRLWEGEVRVLVFDQASAGSELDYQTWTPEQLPCEFIGGDVAQLSGQLLRDPAHSLLLLAPYPDFLPVARRCLAAGLPVVLVTEYSLRTQLQILRTRERRPLKLFRSFLWHLNESRRWSQVSRDCAGVQCNGLPDYDHQASLNPNTLLYFDSRSTLAECMDARAVRSRFERSRQRGFPRFLFSGRLISTKGVQDLVQVATRIRQLCPEFELWIAGDGDLKSSVEEQIRSEGLSKQVRLLGVLDFHAELLPMLKESVDIFLCPHLQGDPSCTYVETMSAGVPIVGYANEALQGLVETVKCGQVVPLRDTKSLAQAAVGIWNEPGRLLDLSLEALAFARDHTFEVEFQRRMDHLGALRPR